MEAGFSFNNMPKGAEDMPVGYQQLTSFPRYYYLLTNYHTH